jgi:sugar lactone lactonase YvrE
VKIYRISPGGSNATEFGNTPIPDPDTVTVDLTGSFSGTPGAVLVGGQDTSLNPNRSKIWKVAPDGNVTTLLDLGAPGDNPNSLLFDPNGRLLWTGGLGVRGSTGAPMRVVKRVEDFFGA